MPVALSVLRSGQRFRGGVGFRGAGVSVIARNVAAAPVWTEARITAGRGNVGSGLFDRVFFVDVFDGAQGLVTVRNLPAACGRPWLSQVISTGHEVALEDDRSPMILLPQTGSIFCAMGALDLTARPGQALVLPRGRRRTVTQRDGDRLFRALALRLPDGAAAPPLAAGAKLDLDELPDLATAAIMVARLSEESPCPDLTVASGAVETLVEGAFAQLRAGLAAPARLPATDRALRRAEAVMEEHLGDDITIRDIADRAGLGMRQMQHLFASRHGLSPHAWLTRLRLEQAHRQLKGAHPAPSVTDAALSAGLTHLGRFPAQYRARFGVLPSVGRAALP